jgi:hypothetical protein
VSTFADIIAPDVDVEGLIASFLRGEEEVIDLVSTRIYTDMPHNRVYPLVLIQRSGGKPQGGFALSEATVRLDLYHDGHMAAQQLASTVVAVLTSRLPGSHDLGCVSAFTAASKRYEPDPEAADRQGHARPRYVIEATVYCHP